MKKYRVVITTNTLCAGGAERQRVILANGLASRGWDVELRLIQQGGELEGGIDSGVRVRSLDRRVFSGLISPQTVFISGTTKTEVAHVAASRLFSRESRWLIAAHNPTSVDRRTYPLSVARLAALADRQLCLSRIQSDHLTRNDRFDPSKVRLIPNGIDTSAFLAVERKAPSRAVRLGFIGRLVEQKGLDIFLDALLGIQHLPWTAVISGSGPQGELQNSARYTALGERIRWTGTRDAVRTMSEIDILVVPSRNEAYPLIVLEGLVAGLPILANRVGAIPEILAESPGLAADLTTASSLARLLEEQIINIDDAFVMARDYRRIAAAKHDAAMMIQQYEDVINEVVVR